METPVTRLAGSRRAAWCLRGGGGQKSEEKRCYVPTVASDPKVGQLCCRKYLPPRTQQKECPYVVGFCSETFLSPRLSFRAARSVKYRSMKRRPHMYTTSLKSHQTQKKYNFHSKVDSDSNSSTDKIEHLPAVYTAAMDYVDM